MLLPRSFLRRSVASALALCALTGCASPGTALGYYWQSFRGHMALMNAAQPIDDWLTQDSTSPALRQRLALAQRARQFAIDDLALPDNASYRRYAALGRPAAVWNVVAAGPYTLRLHTWCFPVTGCIGYRGYFAEADAQAEADRLAATGQEVHVYGVPAYSTLGYSNWMGGDPLLSTFIGWHEGDFVRLLFHELAHQVAYAADDTGFNESYATAVERLGVAQWLQAHATAAVRDSYAASEVRRAQYRALTQRTRAELQKIYKENKAPAQSQQALEAIKTEAYQRFRTAYAALRQQWLNAGTKPEQLSKLDEWVQGANNASFGAQGAYDDAVPAFLALIEREGRDWQRFHQAVQALAQAPKSEREAAMQALTPTTAAAGTHH